MLLVAIVMAVGIVGVVLPVLPGLLLVWAAGLWWVVADGGGAGRWAVLVVMTVLLAAGTLAKYVLPARATAAAGVPWSTLAVGAVGAVAGFFFIPVVGLLVGGITGVYLAELVRLKRQRWRSHALPPQATRSSSFTPPEARIPGSPGDWRQAARSTRAALVAFGIGVLVELTAGVAMALTWFVGELAT